MRHHPGSKPWLILTWFKKYQDVNWVEFIWGLTIQKLVSSQWSQHLSTSTSHNSCFLGHMQGRLKFIESTLFDSYLFLHRIASQVNAHDLPIQEHLGNHCVWGGPFNVYSLIASKQSAPGPLSLMSGYPLVEPHHYCRRKIGIACHFHYWFGNTCSIAHLAAFFLGCNLSPLVLLNSSSCDFINEQPSRPRCQLYIFFCQIFAFISSPSSVTAIWWVIDALRHEKVVT